MGKFTLEIEPSEVLHTKFGTAKVNELGYYRITSGKEKNHLKFLHRLMFEDFYGEIPKGFHIHHKDKNKLNCCIMNLELIDGSKHLKNHRVGSKHSSDSKLKISKFNNTTGYFRVFKLKDESCKQGFLWAYQYYEDGKRKIISRVNLEDLEKEVVKRKLEWHKFEKEMV